jgi:hypothetical protein
MTSSSSSSQLRNVTVYLGRLINNVLITEPLDNPEYDNPYTFHDLQCIYIQSDIYSMVKMTRGEDDNDSVLPKWILDKHDGDA